MNQHIINNYKLHALQANTEAAWFKKLADSYSLLRLGVFALLIAGVYTGVWLDNFNIIAAAVIITALVFVWLVSRQSHFERERNYFINLARVNQNEIDSINHMGNLYANGSRFGHEKHYYTADLDIFGDASLFQLVNRAATAPGNQTLAQWLSAPANKQTIMLRQHAVNELAVKNNHKLEIQTLLLFAAQTDVKELKNLLAYLNMPVPISGEQWLKKYFAFAPLVMIAVITLAFFIPVYKFLAIIVAIIHAGLVFSRSGSVKKAELIVGKIGVTLDGYAAAFAKIEKEEWQSDGLKVLSQQLKERQTSAQIKQLAVLVNKFNNRNNLLVGSVLNLLFLWDLKQVIAIEDWKHNNSSHLETAFEVLAQFEALISLAGLRINYPQWAIPQIADGHGYTLSARNVAHPLIRPEKRVANDYELEDAFKVDIITGSNMAGKSTFLRTMGINTVLALCGAPVCATQMRVSVISIISYMRIKDSLNENTSTFKAELDRLQMLLAAVETDNKIFFLIDEMLRGTNSVDKYRGSKAVIEQLISKKAVGMVATHDLQIAHLESKYPAYVRNFYFDIQVQQGEMLFDYKLKHGECKTFNASLLLKQIGIDVEKE